MMFNYEPVHINSFVPVAFTTFFRPLLFFVFPLSPLRGVRGKMVFPSKKIQLPRGEREKSSKFPKSFSAFLNKAPDLNKVRGEFHFFCQNSLSLIPLFLIRLTLRSWWKVKGQQEKEKESGIGISKKYVDNGWLRKRATDHPRWRKQKRGSDEWDTYYKL